MRLLLAWHNKQPLELPINYNHILQGIIYKALSSHQTFTKYLHDDGMYFGKRNYKSFTFSLLNGHYHVANRRITFDQDVSFEIRSPDVTFIKVIAEYIYRNGITFGDNHMRDIHIKLVNQTIEDDQLIIKMKSPIICYSTDPNTRYMNFYNPEDPSYSGMLSDNFIRKYIAYYATEPTSNIDINVVKVEKRDRIVTNYKGIHYTAWYGQYQLRGERKHLDFLYNIGLGSKNGAGFGMFNVLEGQTLD